MPKDGTSGADGLLTFRSSTNKPSGYQEPLEPSTDFSISISRKQWTHICSLHTISSLNVTKYMCLQVVAIRNMIE